ncbi:hypothetical protein WJX73_007073 [Symbiochloris irregularis]|uniref:F-box domain-containing protein n=1 Tax=Symbiochloris irregularis TaxID=706552 RepID=A0AAW1PCL9_9CHLO
MPVDKRFRCCADWADLPAELLSEVFSLLPQRDLLQAERCCRSWLSTLRSPQIAGLWGAVQVDLGQLPVVMAPKPSRYDYRYNDDFSLRNEVEMFAPVCRWLKSRVMSGGITSLKLGTKFCLVCAQRLNHDDARPPHCASAQSALIMIMAALESLPLDVQLSIQVTVTGLKHLKMLSTHDRPDESALDGMSSLLRLESLDLNGCHLHDTPIMWEMLPSLQRLKIHHLYSGFEEFPGGAEEFIDILDCLTTLTALDLHNCSIQGLQPILFHSLSNLKEMSLESSYVEDCRLPGTWAQLTRLNLDWNSLTCIPDNLSALTSLVKLQLGWQNADFQIREPMSFLTQMPRLREVYLCNGDRQKWNAESLWFLMQAQLLIDNTPDCQVKLNAQTHRREG